VRRASPVNRCPAPARQARASAAHRRR
jgi:hypothetical protein